MKLIRMIFSYSVVLSFLTLVETAWSQDFEALGVSCDIRLNDQSVVQLSETSLGPWVIAERTVQSGNKTFLIRVEASQRHNGWGVIWLKEVETGVTKTIYGPVPARNVFRLDHKEISIFCNHWPYIAG